MARKRWRGYDDEKNSQERMARNRLKRKRRNIAKKGWIQNDVEVRMVRKEKRRKDSEGKLIKWQRKDD